MTDEHEPPTPFEDHILIVETVGHAAESRVMGRGFGRVLVVAGLGSTPGALLAAELGRRGFDPVLVERVDDVPEALDAMRDLGMIRDLLAPLDAGLPRHKPCFPDMPVLGAPCPSHVVVADGRVQMVDERPSWQTPYGPRGGRRGPPRR